MGAGEADEADEADEAGMIVTEGSVAAEPAKDSGTVPLIAIVPAITPAAASAATEPTNKLLRFIVSTSR